MNDMPMIMLILITQLFIAYTLWRFIRKIIWNKSLEWTHCVSLVFFFISHSIIFIFAYDQWFYYLFLAIIMILFSVLQCGSKKQKLLFFISLFGIYAFAKIIFFVEGEGNYLLTTGVLIAWFLFETELIIETMVSKYHKIQKNSEWYVLCFIPIATFIAIIMVESYILLEMNMKIMIIIFAYWLNIFIFYFYETMLGYYQEILENHQVIFQQKLYETRMENMIKNEKEMSAFRHDLKNHLFALNILADQGETDKIKSYLREMDVELSKSSLKRFSKSKDIDMLLNYFVNKVYAEDATLKVIVDLPSDFQWNMYDLNIILGNLIDNAIDAVQKVSDKEIQLHVKFQKGIFKIKIENVYDGICNIAEGRYLTTKNGISETHGYGLDNVKKIVEKYSGTMDIDSSNYRFLVKILLFQK